MRNTALALSAVTPLPGLHSAAEGVEFSVVMLAVLLVLVLLFRKIGNRYTPRGRGFFCLAIVGMGIAGSTGFFATAPSSAERITIDGFCYDIHEVYFGRGNPQYVFRLTSDTGSVLRLQTPLRSSWLSQMKDGTRLRVTYLNETRPIFQFPRAIAVTVLSEEYIGSHGSVDANWFGAWLFAPLGIAICLTSLACALQNRRLDGPAASGEDNDGRNLDDGQKLGLTDLNLR
jgi:hypothetical protein